MESVKLLNWNQSNIHDHNFLHWQACDGPGALKVCDGVVRVDRRTKIWWKHCRCGYIYVIISESLTRTEGLDGLVPSIAVVYMNGIFSPPCCCNHSLYRLYKDEPWCMRDVFWFEGAISSDRLVIAFANFRINQPDTIENICESLLTSLLFCR